MTGTAPPPESPVPKPPNPPSHEASQKLECQAAAAAAALYVMQPEDTTGPVNQALLSESDRRLSAAGCAVASLKYANPKDIPSFASLGLSSSAGAAASLASSSRKQIPRWKADPSAPAFAAAVLAKDFKATKSWEPGPSTHGVKAALLAHARNPMKPSPPGTLTSPQSTSSNPRSNYGHTTTGREESLQAATGAMAAKRQRSRSAPTATASQPDLADSMANALNAATIAHSPSMNKTNTLPHDVAGGNSRQGLTSSRRLPKQEPAGMKGADVRAAPTSIARQFSAIQQGSTNDIEGSGEDESRSAARKFDARPSPSASAQTGERAPTHLSRLEEAASKLANERLARLHSEHEAYRNYYGINHTQSPPYVQDVARRRAFSVGQSTAHDREQSKEIRSELSLLTDRVAQVDTEKLDRGRIALIAAAQKNVQARMHKMDEKILSETGRLPPSTQEKWEALAIAAAEAESRVRISNYGKINVESGRPVDQERFDTATARNVQPYLGEISETLGRERAKEEIRPEEERQRMIEEKPRKVELKGEGEYHIFHREDAAQSHLLGKAHALEEALPTSPMSNRKIGVKRWFKERLSKRASKDQKVKTEDVEASYKGVTSDPGEVVGSEEPSSLARDAPMAGRNEPSYQRDQENQDCLSGETASGG
ncbi:MAG: hypothetical protein M1839_005565 [Geoglossum umbratile]|nr:MAG: hypothetical protein M1839_005565 [Geoglossum umbratile]